jgi:hypothetical protein
MYSEEIKSIASQWLVKHRSTTDPQAVAKILDRARELCESQGGHFCVAHCERAYIELTNEGAIKPFKGGFDSKPSEGTVPQDVIDFIERSSAFELKTRYKTDATFRRHYDEYQKRPRQPQENRTLTAEAYRRMPSRELQLKLRNPHFKLQVMQLIKAGQI